MREKLCFAAQNVPRKMNGEGLPRGGCDRIIFERALHCNCRFRRRFANRKLSFLKDVSHESFVFLIHLSIFEGRLGRNLRFHNLSFGFCRGVSHESFVFTSLTFRFRGTSRTKASFSHLQLSVFEAGLAGWLRFHIFNFQVLREVLNESFIFTPSLIAMASECSQELLATQFKELLAYCTAEQQEAVYQVARND